ncbi:MAG: glycosyltransferase family 4 protein, partial [Flavisolibacter sp.]|nr:glycosyltransferase family 4 protein [Flavisolibacter sp.]
QTAVKEKYTEGKEYFIYVGAIHLQKNIINLLKAFSIFKKRQRSSMKLVLCGRLVWKNDAFFQLLKTYKYRNDVLVTGYIAEAELAHLIGSAYALVYPSLFEGFGMPVLEALQCRVPVLTSAHSAMQEISNTAALYFDAADPASMADQLMLIYKDEDLRRTLIEKGRSVAKKYSWQRTAELMWACIEKAGK